ncbi:MAG: thiamine diphosphokinase [Pseudomonadota bacterium]
MNNKLSFDEPVCLLGGGDVPENLALALPQGPLICADSGADYALLAGRKPVAVIGDMDSINPTVRARFADVVHPIADQNSTDFEKCLSYVEAPFIYGFGFLGKRMDHTIASLSSLARFADRPIALVGDGDVTICIEDRAQFATAVGTQIGILPWPFASCESTGLKWELNELDLSLGAQISSSNMAKAKTVDIKVKEGRVLVTIARPDLTMLPAAFGLSFTG